MEPSENFEPIILIGFSKHNLSFVDNETIAAEALMHRGIKLSDDPIHTFNEDSQVDKSNEAIADLIERVTRVMHECVNPELKFGNIWAHIIEPNASTMIHNHHNFQHPIDGISWAYYPVDMTDCGEFVFNINVGCRVVRKPIQPQQGDLLIFPDYVDHFTMKNRSGRDRVVISGNFYIDDPEEAFKDPSLYFNYTGVYY